MNGFDDFAIEIGTGSESGYPVTARAPDGAEVAGIFRLPFPGDEIERRLATVRDAVLLSSISTRRAATRDELSVQVLGRELFEALLTGGIRELYGTSVQHARRTGREFRLVLRTQTPEIARLPWEYMYDSGRREYVGLSGPLLRYPQVLDPVRPLRVAPPLRILGMVARPGEQDPLQVADEQQRLASALGGLLREGLVELDWVEGETFEALEDALDGGSWHVWHFIGHGGFDAVRDEGFIVFANEYGRTHRIGAEHLAWWLGRHHPLRLVLLNACQTGEAGGLDVYAGTAGALVQRGVPAVVAMQFEITDAAAVQFARSFYRSVAKQLPVDQAVLRARHHLRLQKHDTLEWGTPVLYLRSRDGRLFDVTDATREPIAVPDEEPAGRPGQEDIRSAQASPGLEGVNEQTRDVHYRAGLAHMDAGSWQQAVEAFEQVTELDATYRDVQALLARARRELRSALLGRALAAFQAVLSARERQEAHPKARRLRRGRIEPRHVLRHRDAVNVVAFSPDGSLLATGSNDATARVWSVASGEEIVRVDSDSGVRAVAFSPDGSRLALGVYEHVRVCDSAGRMLFEHKVSAWGYNVVALAFSPDGRRLAARNDSSSSVVWLLDPANGTSVARISHGLLGTAYQIAFSPDSRFLATANAVTEVTLWEATSGERRHVLNVHGEQAVAFSPNGRLLVTCGHGSVSVWDCRSWKLLRELSHPRPEPEENWLSLVAVSPDSRRIAASSSHEVLVWDAGSGKRQVEFTTAASPSTLAFSPDGRWLATSNGASARIWAAATGQQTIRANHGGTVGGAVFSPDGRWLATVSDDKTAKLWPLEEEHEDG